jgi:hypothetical protein
VSIFGGPLEAVLGGVDELVVLEGLPGLLVHWFRFPFCSPRSIRFERTCSREGSTQNFKSIRVKLFVQGKRLHAYEACRLFVWIF